MSLPIVLAARSLKIKIYLIEPNQVIGEQINISEFLKKYFVTQIILKIFPRNMIKKLWTIYPLISKKIYNFRRQEKTSKNLLFWLWVVVREQIFLIKI